MDFAFDNAALEKGAWEDKEKERIEVQIRVTIKLVWSRKEFPLKPRQLP